MNDFVDLVAAIAWPVTVLLIAALAVSSDGQQAISRLTRRVRKVGGMGFEVELTEEAATRVKADLEATFSEYRAAIKSEFDRQANLLHIAELRRRVLEVAVNPALDAGAATPLYRSTIHVRDILLHESIYQLLDYLPSTGSSGKAGRTFSMRFGIVGEAWRSGSSRQKTLTKPGDDFVVTSWGMLPDEAAEAGRGKRSFAAAVIKHDGLTVGVFYLDSGEAEVFTDELVARIEAACQSEKLAPALAQLESRMRERGPALTIFDA